jgi:hypothetical protein
MGMEAIRKIYAFSRALAAMAVAAPALLAGCSAAPIKVECQQLRTRMEYESMTEDQLRFAKGELEDCEERMHAADRKDSALIDSTEQRFTPKD